MDMQKGWVRSSLARYSDNRERLDLSRNISCATLLEHQI